MTALFVKPKIIFVIVTLEINKYTKIPSIVFSYRLQSIGRTQSIPENDCSFGNGTPNQWAPTKKVPVSYDKFLKNF